MRQLSLFPRAISMARIDPKRNMRRFYRMTIVGDLFGGVMLWREWGRIGSIGRFTSKPYDSEGAAVTDLAVSARRKQRRGYVTHDEH